MKTFAIFTLGCKVNSYESAQIRQFLEGRGLNCVKPVDKPDLFVINTCCVTSTASAKSRQYIKRALKLNPAAVRVICGCLAAIKTGELDCEESSTTHLISDRTELPAMLYHITGGPLSGDSSARYSHINSIGESSNIKPEKREQVNNKTELSSLPVLPFLTSFKEQTRAFLKVQDGCDGLCAYCIIPKVRPVVQSKPIEDAVFEAKNLVSAGHKEIVVTGVNLGAYGRESTRKRAQIADCRLLIADLIEELAEIEGLKRLRVSSLEPGDITAELMDVFCAHSNIMPHIHLSVQSGSDNVLKRMCRPYSAGELRDKISLIKGRLDRPAITCDIIVGFPGETEEDFQETVEFSKWAGFSKMHVFPFSARMGTAASRMKGRVDSKVIKKRAEILRRLGEELGVKFREQFLGETCEVLLENDNPPSGHCERYFLVSLDPRQKTKGAKPEDLRCAAGGWMKKNDILKVKIMAVDELGAEAEITF
jgi:threonylcarbamoyladenosine tRNA methylthiotransferase MtaB